MCFSPEADLIGGFIVSGVGIDALRHVRHKRDIALAALPVLFGVHQMIEAFVWWGLVDRVPATLEELATWVYLTIAFALPLLVPSAIMTFEPDQGRRLRVVPFVVLGGLVTAVLLIELYSGPVTTEIVGRTIAYDVHLSFGGLLTALYVAATCGPLLLSSNLRVRVFGVLNLTAVTVLAWLTATRVISLWCAWAAVTSLVIVVHLRTADQPAAEAPIAV
jgi:hypothetical protein